MKPFPWAEAMQFGFGVLHLSPEAFWKMTPRELAHAITAVRGRAPAAIGRTEFDALMKAFPDQRGKAADVTGDRQQHIAG